MPSKMICENIVTWGERSLSAILRFTFLIMGILRFFFYFDKIFVRYSKTSLSGRILVLGLPWGLRDIH